MINKESLWFLTLFSLILVLSVYYIPMDSNDLLTNFENVTCETEDCVDTSNSDVEFSMNENEAIVALRVENQIAFETEVQELEKFLADPNKTTDEKSSIIDKIRSLNDTYNKERDIEQKLKEYIKSDVFVDIQDYQINVIVGSETHSITTANDIMRLVQEEFNNKVYITVEFK